jgi:hypothetical protein
MSVTLHIGMGKCGSSSLQTFLTQNFRLIDFNKKKYVYGILRPNGSLITGFNFYLLKKANFSNFGYISSANYKKVINDLASVGRLSRQLAKYNGNRHLLLSNEGWGREYDLWSKYDPFTSSDIKVNIVMYIRPPVCWMNSAWWQWGAWTGLDFSTWFERTLLKCNWNSVYEKWKSLPFVKDINVRVLTEDIVSDFCEHLNIDVTMFNRNNKYKVNQSLPSEILRFLQKYPELRPSAHSSKIDFILSRQLNLKGKPDWILDKHKIKKIVNSTHKSNMKIKQVLSSQHCQAMESDPRWWSENAYHDKKAKSPHLLLESEIDYDSLTYALVKRIVEMDSSERFLSYNRWKRRVILKYLSLT